jgi:purine-binding chemotaxis protein CheW
LPEAPSPPVESFSSPASQPAGLNQFVVFRLSGQRFGLRLPWVQRVVRAVEITPLPGGPEIILGLVNIHGEVVYVLNLRRALGLPDRELDVGDQFILAKASGRMVALVADQVAGVLEFKNDQVKIGDDFLSSSWRLYGVARTDEEIIPILDLDRMILWEQLGDLDRSSSGNDLRHLHD